MAILGIDEVGRGPWAGPLVVGAVILPEWRPSWIKDLRDSKQLTPRQRAQLSAAILNDTRTTGLGWVRQHEIDEMGLSAALREATSRAIHALLANAPDTYLSEIVIDGPQNFLAGTSLGDLVTNVIRGDSLVQEVSAASIIAKVARDDYMVKIADRYPAYAFDRNKGYGTALHAAALKEHGVTPEHRLSLKPVREVLGLPLTSESSRRKDTTGVGRRAESVVANYLVREGHRLLVRNYKTQLCEIDLVSMRADKIYFTEVKYRQDPAHGDGFAAITPVKKRQMELAAQIFLANRPEYQQLDPLLAAADVTGKDFVLRDYLVLSE